MRLIIRDSSAEVGQYIGDYIAKRYVQLHSTAARIDVARPPAPSTKCSDELLAQDKHV